MQIRRSINPAPMRDPTPAIVYDTSVISGVSTATTSSKLEGAFSAFDGLVIYGDATAAGGKAEVTFPCHKKSPPISGGLFYLMKRRLLVDHVVRDRNLNRIRHVVIVGLHRDDLAGLSRLLLTFRNVRHRENDAALNWIDFENTHADLLSFP